MGKKTIYNPLEKLVVGGGKELSILDLFISDYNLFNDIKEGKLEILLDSEVIKFFDKCNMPNKKNLFMIINKASKEGGKYIMSGEEIEL